MCSFHCYEDLPTCGEGGIRTHGGDEPHNGFRDRPIRPLWHLSCQHAGVSCVPMSSKQEHLTLRTRIIAKIGLNFHAEALLRIGYLPHPGFR